MTPTTPEGLRERIARKFMDAMGVARAIPADWDLFQTVKKLQELGADYADEILAALPQGGGEREAGEITAAVDGLVAIHRRLMDEVGSHQADRLTFPLWSEGQAWKDATAIMVATVELERTITALTSPAPGGEKDFQARVQPWMAACFGPAISADRLERNDRFIEEALELVQASGYTKDRAHALVDYTFNRPQGEINQEVGGVMVTLAAHCLAHGINMHEAGETELARIWTKVEQIRAKQATKPQGSALPIPTPSPDALRDAARHTVWQLEQLSRIARKGDGRSIAPSIDEAAQALRSALSEKGEG